MAFGLNSDGFTRKRLSDIKGEIEDALRQRFGNFINLLPQSVFGNLVGVFADREAEIWELAEDVYNSQYPDTAEGVSLDNVAAITGIVRQPATKSKIQNVCLFGTAGTLVPQGTELAVAGNTQARFVTDSDRTLVAGVDEVQLLTFATLPLSGSFRLSYRGELSSLLNFDATAPQIQAALNALPSLSGVVVTGSMGPGFTITFAGADGKQPQPLIVVSNNTTGVLTTLVSTVEGVSQGQVDVTAIEFGPTQALYGTLTVINTPVFGLDSVKNIEAAIVGRNVETDLELRARRANTLQVAGAATPDAIRARLLNVEGVTDALIFENISTVVDVNGRPPKSFESVVAGGDDQDIFDTLWASKPAGIETFGFETGSVLDSMGVSQTVKFSRPTNVSIYCDVTLTVDSLLYPATGDDVVRDAIVNFINTRGIGGDIITYPQLISVFAGVPGILDVVIRIGKLPSPTTDDNVIILANEIPVTDNLKVTVTSP